MPYFFIENCKDIFLNHQHLTLLLVTGSVSLFPVRDFKLILNVIFEFLY